MQQVKPTRGRPRLTDEERIKNNKESKNKFAKRYSKTPEYKNYQREYRLRNLKKRASYGINDVYKNKPNRMRRISDKITDAKTKKEVRDICKEYLSGAEYDRYIK